LCRSPTEGAPSSNGNRRIDRLKRKCRTIVFWCGTGTRERRWGGCPGMGAQTINSPVSRPISGESDNVYYVNLDSWELPNAANLPRSPHLLTLAPLVLHATAAAQSL